MPKDTESYGWKEFVTWALKNGIELKYEDDWMTLWECWKAGYCAAMSV